MAPPAVAAPPPTTSMVCARQGRLRQRYEGCYRLVSGCIPYMLREEGGEESGCQDVLGRLQVLMISTPKRGDLIFPKGGWEDDESIDEAACREAFEEAGVKGVISSIIYAHASCMTGGARGLSAVTCLDFSLMPSECIGYGRMFMGCFHASHCGMWRAEWSRLSGKQLRKVKCSSSHRPLIAIYFF